MPHNDGSLTQQEQIAAWRAGGKQGPHPCPPAKTPEQRRVRAEIDALLKQLKRGKYAPRVLSDSEIADRAEVKRLRRAAVIQSGMQRVRSGPTKQQIAESWLARGRPADEPVPDLVQQQQAAKVRWNNKRLIEAALRKLERSTAPQVTAQAPLRGRPDLPLDSVAGARLQVWFAVWDGCVVPAEFDDEPVRYGAVTRVDWQRVPVLGVGRWGSK